MKFPPPPSSVTGATRDFLGQVHDALRVTQPVTTFTTTASDITLNESWHRVRVKASSVRTVYLPDATRYKGWVFHIKSVVESTNTVRIQPITGQVIDGAATASIITAGVSLMLHSYGTGWDLV